MQDETLFDSTRNELLERLKALEGPQASGSLAELAYRRAREALEKALDEARTIRLQAIEDARNHREREMTALADSLRNLRQSAETQIDALLREAEIEAERIRDTARDDARNCRRTGDGRSRLHARRRHTPSAPPPSSAPARSKTSKQTSMPSWSTSPNASASKSPRSPGTASSPHLMRSIDAP